MRPLGYTGQFAVAEGAADLRMDRLTMAFHVNKEGDFAAGGVRFGKLGLAVTFLALTIRRLRGSHQGQKQPSQQQEGS
ncbi:MAG: hypothetical protein C4524_14260 [Candidatus Zixiibacteriota bacterium]|nr:MAG: hypothetical protein C4524_14260 [candidate division Zixibacteria bacterium]